MPVFLLLLMNLLCTGMQLYMKISSGHVSYVVLFLYLWSCSYMKVKKFVPNKKGDIGMEVYYLCQPNTCHRS